MTPGQAIKSELEKRGWTQYDLAAVLGKHQPAINELIQSCQKNTIKSDAIIKWIHTDQLQNIHFTEISLNVLSNFNNLKNLYLYYCNGFNSNVHFNILTVFHLQIDS